MKLAVLGAGAWGTALARMLHQGGHAVTLWGHNAEHLEEMRRSGRNERYLPGISLPEDWMLELDLARAVAGSELIVAAVPSKAFRKVTAQLAGFGGIVVSVTKGIEHETGLSMCGILGETVPGAQIAALSGPTFASEVAMAIPTAIVAASNNAGTAKAVQKVFHRPAFRVYTSADVLGVELGGALKNVIAIAAGVCDGLGFGDNSKAALITRAMAEVRRLGVTRASGDVHGLERPGGFDGDVFFQIEPQPRIWRAIRPRGKIGGRAGEYGGGGGRASHDAFGISSGAEARRGHAGDRRSLPHAIRRQECGEGRAGLDVAGYEGGGLNQLKATPL